MPIIVSCRDCGKQYRLRDDLAGSILPCKDCGANFRVPSTGSASASSSSGGGRKSRYSDSGNDRDDEGDWEESMGQSSRSGSNSMMY